MIVVLVFFFKQKSAYEIAACLVGSDMCICFFFKQKTAYEIMPSLVGSEMCIRDRLRAFHAPMRRRAWV